MCLRVFDCVGVCVCLLECEFLQVCVCDLMCVCVSAACVCSIL